MKKKIYWSLLIAVLLPPLDLFGGLWFSWNPRIVIRNNHAGPLTGIAVGEPIYTLDRLDPGDSRTFRVAAGDMVRHSVRFRTSRKRLFTLERGTYSGGMGWDLITITVNKKGQIEVVEENWSGSHLLRKPSNYYSPKPYAPLEKLIQDLGDSTNYGKRAVAASNISYRPEGAAAAIPPLVKAIRDQKDQYWMIFSYTLGKIGAPAVTAVTPLLQDDRAQNRQAGAHALETMGPPAAPAVPELTRCLRDSVPAVRKQCLTALGKIGDGAQSAVPEIISLSKTLPTEELRVAIDALEAIGTKETDEVVDSYWLKDFNKGSKDD